MRRGWNFLMRKPAPILSMGLLLQAGGCSADLSGTVQTLVSTIANNLVASFVFGAFNLPTGF